MKSWFSIKNPARKANYFMLGQTNSDVFRFGPGDDGLLDWILNLLARLKRQVDF